MYQVVIKNGNEETIINALSTDVEAPRLINGNIKQGINTIDSFNFDILSNNVGYTKLNALTTLVEVLNTKSNIITFKGRVLLPIESMDNNGKFIKKVMCEGELGYLMDSTTRYGEYHNISVKDFLKVILDNHNSQVDNYKKIELGVVEVTDNNSLYRFLDYSKSLDVIKDKLLNKLGGEILIRYENGVRYLDYLYKIGERKETDIRLSKNLQTIEQEKDPTSVITRLIPLGAKQENSDERLTIKSVNNGLDYIDDIEAINEFGVIVDTFTWDDVKEPSNLIRKGNEKLLEVNKIKKKHKISALDLSLIGLDFNSFEVFNEYPIINPIMNIDEYLRVVEKTTDINNPQNSSLTVGDKFEDIKEYQLGISKANKNIETISNNLNSVVSTVGAINTELNNTVEVISQTNQILTTTNQTVKDITDTITNINNKLDANVQTTKQLTTTTNNIQTNLIKANDKIEKLKNRMFMGV